MPGKSVSNDSTCKLAGITPVSMAINTLESEHSPEDTSECPMLDFTAPTGKEVSLFLQKLVTMARSSCMSPAGVPT